MKNSMNKTAPTLLTLMIIVLGGYLIYQVIYNPIIVSFVPTPQPGIERLRNINGNGRFLWSPTEMMIIGSSTNFGPCPDWGCSQESEIFLVDLETHKKKTIYKIDQYGFHIIGWSSDGKRILVSVEGEGVLATGIWSMDFEEPGPPEFITDRTLAAWSYDGTKMAVADFIDEPGGKYPVIDVVDLETGQKRQVFKASMPSSIWSLSWSADGKQIAFLHYDQKPNIYVLQLETREITQIASNESAYDDGVFSPQDNLIALKKSSQGYEDSVVIKDLFNDCQVEMPVEKVKLLGSWSPDGRRFAFSTYDDDVYIVDLGKFLGFDFQKTGSLCP